MLHHHIQVAQALLSSFTGAGRGMMGTAFPQQPAKALKLYEFEGSPYCRRVREVMTLLNLDYVVYPCPKGGRRYRDEVKALGGKTQFPFLVDENNDEKLYESTAIIDYLFKNYSAQAQTPKAYQHYPKIAYAAFAGTLINGARGVWLSPQAKAEAPEQLLELWGFEASPYTRVVRSLLCELEIAYIFHNVAKERWQDQGPAMLRLKPGAYVPLPEGKRAEVVKRMARHDQGIQVPYLVDPNTGASLFESAQIVAYIKKHYAKA